MKRLSKLCVLLFLPILVGSACEDESNDSLDSMQQRLIGTWLEIRPCDSCSVFSITDDAKIIKTRTFWEEELKYSYRLLSHDRIEVTREWLTEEDEDKKTTSHQFNFIGEDTLELIQFIAKDRGVTGFSDVTLSRIEQ